MVFLDKHHKVPLWELPLHYQPLHTYNLGFVARATLVPRKDGASMTQIPQRGHVHMSLQGWTSSASCPGSPRKNHVEVPNPTHIFLGPFGNN